MKKPVPFSNNIIFYDAEFTDLDVQVGELVSVGLIKMDGKSLYLELDYNGKVHPWVEKNVIPNLSKKKVTKEKAREKIWDFIGKNKKEKDKPYLMAYVNQFDAIFWYKLFGGPKNHPVFWIPIDFASILFAFGFSPDSMGKKRFFDELGIKKDKYNEHNALDDAKLLKEVYIKLYEKISQNTK